MIKLYGLLPKRADLTEDQFHHHWGTLHAALGARIGAMRHYVQNHRIPIHATGTRTAVWDGVAECWFDSIEAADIGAVPDYTDNAGRDDPTFLDMDRLAFMALEEVERIGAGGRGWTRADPAPGANVLWFVRKNTGVDVADFRAFMVEHARRMSTVDPPPARYTHGVPVGAADEPLYDGVEELSWTGCSLLESAWHARTVQDALADAAEMIDVDASAALVTRERRVY